MRPLIPCTTAPNRMQVHPLCVSSFLVPSRPQQPLHTPNPAPDPITPFRLEPEFLDTFSWQPTAESPHVHVSATFIAVRGTLP